MPLRVTVALACPACNRQATDIGIAFAKRGAIVRTHTSWDCSDEPNQCCGVAERILSWFPHGRGLGRACDFARSVGLPATDVLVCVNYPSLLAAPPLAALRRPKVIYYCLETVKDKMGIAIETSVCRRLSAVVLLPEENRARALQSRLEGRCSVHVVPNVPYLRTDVASRGRLRDYVAARLHRKDLTIVIYSGVYHSYNRIEQIVASSAVWPSTTCLVLMLAGLYPNKLSDAVRASQNRAIIVPPVGTGEVFDWIADADIGLLPYEDEDDINVRYCAPQKLFDYVACGIPFIGSCRPSIEAIANEVGCGLCIDMTDGAALAAAVKALGSDSTLRSVMAEKARKAHVEKYNYERYIAPICSSIIPPFSN